MAKTFIDPFANNNVLSTVADLQGQVTALQANKKADTEAINGMVIEQYAQLIPCAIAVGVRVTSKAGISKGKLVGGADVIDNFKTSLTTEGGFSESVMKKRYENTIKAVVSFGWDKNSTNLTADGVKGDFKASKYTAEDWAEFDNEYRALRDARLAADMAAEQAKVKAAEENETVDSVVDQF